MVVLVEFAAEYTKPWWIPFAVRCVVATDHVAALAAVVAPVADLIGNDIAAAASLSLQAGVSLAGLSGGNAGYAAAQGAVRTAIANAGASLNTGAAGLTAAVTAPDGVMAMQNIVGSSSQLAALAGMNSYVNRAAMLAGA
jgi:hypothetical protein